MVRPRGDEMTFARVLVVIAGFVQKSSEPLLTVGDVGHWACSPTVTGDGAAGARAVLSEGGQ